MLGLIATRSINNEVPGIKELVARAESASEAASSPMTRSKSCGRTGNDAEQREPLRAALPGPRLRAAPQEIRARRRRTPPTPRSTQAAWTRCRPSRRCSGASASWSGSASSSSPCSPSPSISPRRAGCRLSRLFLRVALLACRCPGSPPSSAGIVAEVGRQPWVIEGVLPTFLAVSSSRRQRLITLIGFVVFYSTLAIVDVYLMLRRSGRPETRLRRRRPRAGARRSSRRIADRQERSCSTTKPCA